jgi:hypothetical protein
VRDRTSRRLGVAHRRATQLIVYEANLALGYRLKAHLWHGFSDRVRADVTFQTRRVGGSS